MNQMDLRILMISSRSDMGGGPRHLYDLCRSMKKLFPCFIAIAAPDEKPFAPKFQDAADLFIPIPKRRFSPLALCQIISFCRKHDIHIIHSHGRGAGIFSRILKIFGYSVVHTFHGAHFEKTLFGTLKIIIDRFLSPFTNQFICVSNDEKEKILEFRSAPANKISVILNGIDYKLIQEQFQERTANDSIVIGTLARFTYQKGIDLLLDNVRKNRSFYLKNKIKIKIAGTGELFEQLSKKRISLKVDDIVEFSGQQEDPAQFLSSLNIYFSFARWEGLPLSVLEAMSCPLPCLLSNVTGHKELVKNNEALLFHLDQEDDFIKKLSFLTNRETWIELKIRSKELIEAKHSLELMTSQTLAIYRHLC